MGCCESTPEVPETILPDPSYEGTEIFTIRDLSSWNDDYEVLRGAQPSAEHDRWLFLNKSKGDDGQAMIELENYRRFDEEDPKKGQVLYKLIFANKPSFDQERSREVDDMHKAGNMIMSFFGGESLTPISHEDTYYVDRAKRMHHGTDRTRIVKWRLDTQCEIVPVVRNDSVLNGRDALTLKIQSNGTAVACYERKVDDDTGESRWERDVVEFVDCVDFALFQADGTLVAEWRCPGDANELPATATMDNVIFKAMLKGGWSREGDKIIETKEPYDPALGLVVAHMCTGEFSIRAIKDRFRPHFPQNP